ncbi:tubulin binding cofactor C-domain-containing protein [Paraphysoderma sedebokerense]|nr:tubulin binding cofactor C-domain-containing protein [Paraphysoderma sedebokerense]KAI9137832.1 tubulin binding cofactor C-domain-containing protein [Paraphysoderma sedebokerense]
MMTTSPDATAFWLAFQKQKQVLESELNSAATVSKSNLSAFFDSILQRIKQLEKEVTDAVIWLPQYDQRQCFDQVRTLLVSLETKKTELTPKTKFSFKSRKQPPGPSSSTSSKSEINSVSLHQSNPTSNPEAQPAIQKPSSLSISSNSISISNYTSSSIIFPRFNYSTKQDFNTQNVQSYDISITNITNSTLYIPFPSISSVGPSSVDPSSAPASVDSVSNTTGNTIKSNDLPSLKSISAIHISNIENSRVVLLPPTEGSILISECNDCVLVVACRQFRIHKSRNTKIYLFVASNPIMEECTALQIAEYPLTVLSKKYGAGNLETVFKSANHDPTQNQYTAIQDFDFLKRDQKSPNVDYIPNSTSNPEITNLLDGIENSQSTKIN